MDQSFHSASIVAGNGVVGGRGGDVTVLSHNRFIYNSYGSSQTRDTGFETLARAAVVAATHDSVIGRLMDWIHRNMDEEEQIMWLYGGAGAGKSAIAQTLAELCARQKILLGSFFFSRNDARRATAAPFLATLAYQASIIIPEMKALVATAVQEDPLVFEKSLGTQFESLLIGPLNAIFGRTKAPIPHVIIIDGLDECTDPIVQCRILMAVSEAVGNTQADLKVIFASRPEIEIKSAFTSTALRSAARLALDTSYQADEDIRYFLQSTFRAIKDTHRLKDSIPNSWPTKSDVEGLVKKSSGQFIYASTVAKYFSSPRHHPVERLGMILQVVTRPLHADDIDLPFSALDEVHMHIFSRLPAQNVKTVLLIFGFLILAPDAARFPFNYGKNIAALLLLEPNKIEDSFADLSSILEFKGTDSGLFMEAVEVRITHASLDDFLLDPRRSKQFHIQPASFFAYMVQICIAHINLGVSNNSFTVDWRPSYAMSNLTGFMHKAASTPHLRAYIFGFSLVPMSSQCSQDRLSYTKFLRFAIDLLGVLQSWGVEFEALRFQRQGELDQALQEFLGNYHHDLLSPTLLSSPQGPNLRGSSFTRTWKDRVDEHSDMEILHMCLIEKPYSDVLVDFFNDPSRSGRYALNGMKYAMAALACFRACQDGLDDFDMYQSARDGLLRRLPHFLERSSYLAELVAFIEDGSSERGCNDGFSNYIGVLWDMGAHVLANQVRHASDGYVERVSAAEVPAAANGTRSRLTPHSS